jgi:Cu/Ag efflux pump CusA
VRSGIDIETAVVQSGRARFRPVLLTSITTIAGLLPILLERSFQAQFLIPMAISICFGLLAATVLTLLYVPALYLIVRDVRNAVVARFKRAEIAPHQSAAESQMAVDSDPVVKERK